MSLPQCADIEDAVIWADGRCVPRGITHPFAPWLLDYALPVAAVLAVAWMAISAIRQRRLTWVLMIAVASASTWWLETFGDWGQHLSYSPAFNHYVLSAPYAAPHNPLWMPLMYALYWVAHAWVILWLAGWANRRFNWSTGKGILLLSVPLTFVWNFLIEGFAAWAGWWTYEPGIGPVLDMGRGHWPLLWPMLLMFGWINLIAWMVGDPAQSRELNRLERLMRLDLLLNRPGWASAPQRKPAPREKTRDGVIGVRSREAQMLAIEDPAAGGLRFQVIRLGAWILYFNVTFLLTLVIPLVLVRVVTGWDTPYF